MIVAICALLSLLLGVSVAQLVALGVIIMWLTDIRTRLTPPIVK